MASGAVVLDILEVMPTGTSFATIDARPGGSSPAESVMVYDFDAGIIEYVDYLVRLSGYAGGGLTLTIYWSATSATSGACRWEVAFRRLQDDAEDIDTSQTYDYNAVDDTAASASGELSYASLTFTDGADMDSLAEGELAIMRVRRNATHANDTMTGDAELWAIVGKET